MARMTLDFGHVSREIRSIVSRRRELMLFLGSLFAGMGIYLQNILERKLPPALSQLERSAFLTYSLALLIPSVLIALRVAKLHCGMIINGVLHAKILKETVAPERDPERAGRFNVAGVSTQLFLLTNLVAGFAAAILALATHWPAKTSCLFGVAAFCSLAFLFVAMHINARRFAQKLISDCVVEPFGGKEDVEDHDAESLRDCNHDMLTTISFVGLMLFSVFQGLSGLGGIAKGQTEITTDYIQRNGPVVFSLLLTATCFLSMIIYLRLLVSLGNFSLRLDPTDRPFRVLKLTDSFLGYCILTFFLAISTHVLLLPYFGSKADNSMATVWKMDLAVIAFALVCYVGTLLVAQKQSKPAQS